MPELTMEDRAQALENEYFRRQEQELIEKMRARLASESKEASTHACPKCDGGKLVETDYENIKIDVCNNCHGVWLDAGELAQIMNKEEGKGWFGRLFG
jgi:ribosomal protein L31